VSGRVGIFGDMTQEAMQRAAIEGRNSRIKCGYGV
jgi:hypothetical protein